MSDGPFEVAAYLRRQSVNGASADLEVIEQALEQLQVTPDGHILLEITRAQAIVQLGQARTAADVLNRVGPAVALLRPSRSQHEQLLLQSAFRGARGLVLLTLRQETQSLPDFGSAARGYEKIGFGWQSTAALINLAIAEATVGDLQEALRRLNEVERQSEQLDLPAAWRSARRGNIGVNRAGFLQMTGDADGAVQALVDARPHVVDAGDLMTLGTLDFNLAKTYHELRRYGSALEAASSSAATYESIGALSGRNRSIAAVGAAMTKLDRVSEAERLLTELLSSASDHATPDERVWISEALVALADAYRRTDRQKDAELAERAAQEIKYEPIEEVRAIEELFIDVMDAINALSNGDEPVPASSLRTRIDILRRSNRHPDARVIADMLEAFADALYAGTEPPPLSDKQRQVLEGLSTPSAEWESLIDTTLGMRQGDEDRILHASLGELVEYQRLIAEQETAAYRSELLAGRAARTLDVVLRLLLERDDAPALFEVLEWCRRDFAATREPTLSRSLAPFAFLVGTGDAARASLADPVTIFVRGRSVLRDRVADLPAVADADHLRCALGGPTSAWWTTMVHRGTLIWALLTPDGASCGQAPFSPEARDALQRHLEALPIPMERDIEAMDLRSRPWCAPTVAIARAALGPLIKDEALAERCLRALPDEVAHVFSTDTIKRDLGFEDVYGPLGDFLIPDAINSYLDAFGDKATLLVSVQPELATVPTGLLRTGDGRPMIERASICYAPPARIAARTAIRAPTPGVVEQVLTILDPTGDLTYGRKHSTRTALVGWGAASSPASVATTSNVFDELLASSQRAHPTALALIGHIRGGTPRSPAAAVALAPECPAAEPSYVSASDLTAQDRPMPDRVYLGGCEGSGFATSLEWSSIAAAALANGTGCVVAHRWPILDDRRAAAIDDACIDLIRTEDQLAEALRNRQRAWLAAWNEGRAEAIPPHHWAGLQAIGRAGGCR